MRKLTKKQSTLVMVVAFLLVIPLTVFYLLDENGVFDTRSSADGGLSEELKKADLNGDDVISVLDYQIWVSTFRAYKLNGTYAEIGDLDQDGRVSVLDYAMWVNLWREYKGREEDGIVCETGEECASEVCTTFYKDEDGDTFGSTSETKSVCGVTAPEGYVDNSEDCYDTNADAKPGQESCFETDRGDGSFDYNCDGEDRKCSECYSLGTEYTGGSCMKNSTCHWGAYYSGRTLKECGQTGRFTTWAGECYRGDCNSGNPPEGKRNGTFYKPAGTCTMQCN